MRLHVYFARRFVRLPAFFGVLDSTIDGVSSSTDSGGSVEDETRTGAGAAAEGEGTAATVGARPPGRSLAAAARKPPDEPLATGTKIGRYVLLDRLGAGGMGVVYAAYDPELDRRIAIKLIRAAGDAQDQRVARDRLLREAQALAKLSHPNVVAIHDVGTFADDVFLAMELVQGRTLRDVLSDGRASLAERLRLLIAAGRGLAAAHRAGLVHRDVKPANVLVADDDGGVRVADFGLARAASDRELVLPTPGSTDGETTSSGRLRSPLTELGSVVGTPPYMAPEVLEGHPADALADQFSFCVTAFEALYGVRPFRAKRRETLRTQILRAEPHIPAGVRVPARLRTVLMRGLAKAPQERYPSMDELLDDLAATPVFTPVRVAGAVTVLLALGAATWAIAPGNVPPPCSTVDEELAGTWDESRRHAVRVAFAKSGAAYAATTAARVEAALDDYAGAWLGMRTESCRATRVHGVQSEHLLDLRTACLNRQRAQLAALVDLFAADVDEALVRRAASAAAGLPPVAACADVAALSAAVPPPDDPAIVAAVETLRAHLDRASALVRAGRYAPAQELITPLATDADRLGYEAARAEVRRLLGEAKLRGGDPRGAEPELEAAIRAAALARDDRLAAESWSLLVYALGQQARHQDALLIRTAAEAAVDRAGSDPQLRSSLLSNVGGILNQLERFVESEALFAEAIDLRTRAGADEEPDLASILSNMGNSLGKQGRHDEARVYYDRAIAVWERTLGPDHPQLGIPLNNLGNSLADQGEYAEAERYYRRAIAVWERALGPDSPYLAYPHNGLGGILNEQRRHDEAWPHLERAHALWEAQLGADHPDVAIALSNLGQVRLGQGRHREALVYFRDAYALIEPALGADHTELAFSLTGIGECELALDNVAEAVAALERAWRIRSAGTTAPTELSTSQFALARAVYASGDRRRGRQLATEARARLGDAAAWAHRRAEIDAWLSAH